MTRRIVLFALVALVSLLVGTVSLLAAPDAHLPDKPLGAAWDNDVSLDHASVAAAVRVTITEAGFDPAVITVTVGDEVMWYNATAVTHTLKSGEPYRIYLPVVMRNVGGVFALDGESSEVMPQVLSGAGDVFGGTIPPGGVLTHTFTTPGDFSYFLATALQYSGRIIVQQPPATSPDFAIDAWPAVQTITRGHSISYTVAVTSVNGFTRPVTLDLGGYPTGAAFTWVTNPLTPTASTMLVIMPSASGPTGTFPLVITGTASNLTHTAQMALLVETVPQTDLVVASLTTTPAEPLANQPLSLTVVVKNQGYLAAASSFRVDWYADPASRPVRGQLGDGYWNVSGLCAGCVVTLTTNAVFTTAVNHTLYAQADTLNSVIESDETNNVGGPAVASVYAEAASSYLCGTISENTILTLVHSTYVVSCNVTINSGSNLAVQPGVVVKFNGTSLTVDRNASLRAIGTSASPMVFTSYKDDTYGGDTNNDGGATLPAAGDWGGIDISADNGSSTWVGHLTMDYAIMRYGGNQEYCGLQYEQCLLKVGGEVSVNHSTIEYIYDGGIYIYHGSQTSPAVSIQGSTIRNTGSCPYFWCTSKAGIRINGSSPTISGNTFTNTNSVAIYAVNSAASVLNNSFGVGSGWKGIYATSSNLTIQGNTFIGTNRTGYGMHFSSSQPTLTSNTVSGFQFPVVVENGYPQLVPTYSGNTFTDNGSTAIGVMGTLANGTWTDVGGYMHAIAGYTTIPSGVSFTIPAGKVIKFLASYGVGVNVVGLNVDRNATLTVAGTSSSPVVFTSYKDDTYGGDTNNDGGATLPAAGDWGGIDISADNGSSTWVGHLTMDYAIMRYGGNQEYCGLQYEQCLLKVGGEVSVNHSTIEYIYDGGIYIYHGSQTSPAVSIQGSTIRNTGSCPYFWCTSKAGIRINGSSPTISGNSIYSNTYGLYNSGSNTVDATNNWWGHDSGPYHPTLNPYGLGNAVSDRVNFDPWIGKTSWLAFLSSLSNPNTAFVAEPVNVIMGNYVYEHADLSFPSRGLPFSFRRTYNSTANGTDGPLGYGWTHSYNMAAITETYGSTNAVVIRRADGRRDKYIQQSDGSYAPPAGIYDTLTRTVTGTYSLMLKDQTAYSFDSAGKLTAFADRNGNVATLAYNGSLLTTVTLPDGRAVTFSYNASNRLAQVTDPLSRTVQFTYNASGDLITVNDVRGFVTSFVYDTSHRLTFITDANGHTFVQNTYDAGGRVTRQLDAQNNPTTFGYDQANRRTAVTDTLGNVAVYTYDSEYHSTGEIDALGHSTSYQYDAMSSRIAVTDKNGGLTRYAYDAIGNVTVITDALNYPTTMTYDTTFGRNNLLSQTDPLDNIKRYGYDGNSNLIVITDVLGYTTTMTYYADAARNGLLATVTDARGNVTHYDYDAYGNRTVITDALSNVTRIIYDLVGRKLSDVNARGYTITYEYDAADHLVAVTDTLANRTSYAYDAVGNRVVMTDALGHPTRQAYDAKDQLIIITDTLGYTTVYTYNALGKQVAVRDKNGHTTTYGYDPVGRLVTVTNPLNQNTVFAYDANGNRIAIADALAHSITFAYDALNRLTTTTDPFGKATRNGYDAVGNKTVITDANGVATHYAYDALNRLTAVTDALNSVMQYAYDSVGSKTVMTDANSHVTLYTYDALNRLIRVADPLAHTTAYGYDAIGNRTVLTDANGVVTTYIYDAANRPLTSQAPGVLVSNAYDALGNRTAMTDTTGATTFAYDASSRLLTVTAPGGVVAYRYDGVNRTQTIYPDGKTVTNTYDAADRLHTVADWAGRVTTYTYDAAGQQIGLAYPNGTSAAWLYDDAGRTLAITHTSTVSGTINFFQYALDPVGNRTAVTDTTGTTSYAYDNLYRLTQVVYPSGVPVTVTYAYDRMGNRTAMTDTAVMTYTYDTADRLLNAGPAGFTWDNDGNMLSKGSATYSWDALNRLTSVVSGTQTITFTYNGDGVRTGKSVNGSMTAYVQDIGQGTPYVLVESVGGVGTNYVYGRDLIAMITSGGTQSYSHHDALGSARHLSNDNGQVTGGYWYDAFGAPRSRLGNSPTEFTFTGEQVDFESGLQFLRARYYDPLTGRFLSRDPMSGAEMNPQTLNPYVYVENRSPNLVDPGGTTSKDSVYTYSGFDGNYGIGNIYGGVGSVLGAFRGELPWWWRGIGRIIGYKVQFGGIKIDPLNPFKAGSFGISPFDSDLLKGARKVRSWQSTINDVAELNLYRQQQQFNQSRGDYGSDPMQAERITALRAIEVGVSHIPFPFNFMGGDMLKEYHPFSSAGERLANRTALMDRLVQTAGTPEFDQALDQLAR